MKTIQIELRGESHAPVFDDVMLVIFEDYWFKFCHKDVDGNFVNYHYPASAVACVREWEENET